MGPTSSTASRPVRQEIVTGQAWPEAVTMQVLRVKAPPGADSRVLAPGSHRVVCKAALAGIFMARRTPLEVVAKVQVVRARRRPLGRR